MSDAIYPTRLRWSHRNGAARHDGVHVHLTQPPVLPGLEAMTEIDYAPNIVALVRIGCESMRDMSMDEMHDALALLHKMAHDARDAIDGTSTLVVVIQGRP